MTMMKAMTKLDKLEPSKRSQGCFLAYLEDGSILKLTEQEILDFHLKTGGTLDEETLSRLQSAAEISHTKVQASAIIGRRAMSRFDLEKKLLEKGVSESNARYAADWLEDIGALDDSAYASLLIRHCSDRGYGSARCREELRKHGIPRDLWEEALSEAPDSAAAALAVLQKKYRGAALDEKKRRQAANLLSRRGFSWRDTRWALSEYEEQANGTNAMSLE